MDADQYLEDGVMVATEDKYLNYTHIWNDMRRKKKKDKEHSDFYDFHGKKTLDEKRVKNKEGEEDDEDEYGGSDFDEDKLEEADYLEKRKKSLQKVFQGNKKIKG
jgi:hypothetical protein